VALAIVVAAAAGTLAWQQRAAGSIQAEELARLEGQVERLLAVTRDSSRLVDRLNSRVAALETRSEQTLEAGDLARVSLDSVFTVESATGLGTSHGSGFIAKRIGGDSILITNYHVVEDAYLSSGTVVVTQGDRTFRATVIDVSAAEDVAALRVEAPLPWLPIAADLPRVGDDVLVLGSPIGLEQSVSTGVVSALRAGGIQFTAPISPGSSGGPVLNAAGEVIGISTAGVPGDLAQGIFFAVSSPTICDTVLRCP
jgi:putative serine protease PepD